MNAAIKEPLRTESAGNSASRRQDEINRAVYFARGVHLYYLSKSLMTVEAVCFQKYLPHILGRDVLDIGVGAGRTARHLAPLARRYEAIDYSPVMVRHLKKTMPEISVRQADFRDLRVFADDSFDFVLATANVIDALSHEDRLSALSEAHRVLRPGGVFAFSSHNIQYERAFSRPHFYWSWNPVRLCTNVAMYALGSWNHRRVGPLRTLTPEYALLNDTGHFYSCLHYYAARYVIGLQLAAAGMPLAEVYEGNGRPLTETEDDSQHPWLFYVAMKADDLNPRG